MFLIKFMMYFTLSFMVLSFPINNKTTFSYVYSITSPYTLKLFSTVEALTYKGLIEVKRAGKKLFSNSIPKESDKIKTSLSAIEKRTYEKEKINNSERGHYTAEEEEMLQKVLMEASQ